MMKHLLLALLAAVLLTGCFKVSINSHDEQLAARQAEEFLRLALIDQNYTQAYSHLTEGARQQLSLSRFISSVKYLLRDRYLESLTADEYEPLPGRPAMYIHLLATQANVTYHYRCLMEGSAENGYQVAGFERNPTPFPPAEQTMFGGSKRTKLKRN